ncbi:MAG: biotin synthase BioB [Elusimicrobiota bacterium]|jgi:biotin synthase
MNWNLLAEKSLAGTALLRPEAHAVLDAGPDQIPALVAAAYRVRRRFFGNRVRLNYLLNTKSGLCSEDCHYCSQSKQSQAPIQKYPWLSVEEVLHKAGRALELQAGRLCLVASGRSPAPRELEQMVVCAKAVRERYPQLELCCCLGFLSKDEAEALKTAGVDAVNHNLNTSEHYYGNICQTHSYTDRLSTLQGIRQAGLSACSGALVGMGETPDDILDLAYALRELDVESLPVNFLMPIEGTLLAHQTTLTPTRCLSILCLFRFLNPRASLRIAGGREIHLRSLQSLGLYVANSIFIGDYLTTKGQPAEDDLAMIRDMGFAIEGHALPDDAPAPVPQVVLK